jgi:hypothetical protein
MNGSSSSNSKRERRKKKRKNWIMKCEDHSGEEKT